MASLSHTHIGRGGSLQDGAVIHISGGFFKYDWDLSEIPRLIQAGAVLPTQTRQFAYAIGCDLIEKSVICVSGR